MSILSTIQRNFWRSALVFGVIAILAMGWMLRVPMTNAALDVPQVLTYQARLTDSNRITVDDGNLEMQFSLYDASSGGTCRYVAGGTCGTPTTVSVATVDGIFTVGLGDGVLTNALTDELFDTYPSLYLEIQIAGETLSPLRQVTSAAYAMQAGDSDLLDSLNSDDDGCTEACIVAADVEGNVVVTGDPLSSLAAEAAFYINPATPASDEAIFGVANNGSAIFKIDEDGDIVRIGSTTITNTVNQNTFMLTNNAVTDSDLMVLSATSLTTGDALQITTGAGDSAINVAVGDVTFNDNLTVTGLTMLDGSSSTPDTAAGDGDLFVEDALEVDGLLDIDGTGENDFAGSITARSGSGETAFGPETIYYGVGADTVTYTGSPSSAVWNTGVTGFTTTTQTPSSGTVDTIGVYGLGIDSSSGNTSAVNSNVVFGVNGFARSGLASTSDITAALIGSFGRAQPAGSGDVSVAAGVKGTMAPDSGCTGDCDITTGYGGQFSAGDTAGGTADFTDLYGVSGIATRTGSGIAANVTGGYFTAVGGATNTIGVSLTADHTESSTLTVLTGVSGVLDNSGTGTVTEMKGLDISAGNSGGGTVTDGFGADIVAKNTSGTITTSLTGTRSRMTQSSGSLLSGSGITGSSIVTGSATATDIFGGVLTANSSSSGTTTRAHGGYFVASGATTNYAIYAETGVVHIDDVASSSGSIGVPDIATASGELYVNNDLEVDGVFRADGNIDLGDADTDTVTVTGRFDSDLVPDQDDTHDLGTDALRWQDAYIGAESLHLGTAVGDELHLSYNTTDNGLEFTVGAAGTIDFEISEDGHVGLSNTDAALDNTLTYTDTYDSVSGGNLSRNGTLSTMTFSNNTTTLGTHRFTGFNNVVSASGIDDNTTVSGETTVLTLSGTAPGSLDQETLIGNNVNVSVTDGSSKFAKAFIYSGTTTYDGGATSTGWRGSTNTLTMSGGTISDARTFNGVISIDGGSVTTAYGANLFIDEIGAGSLTDAIGINLDVSNATSDNIAMYVAGGYVHVDDTAFSGAPGTAPTFSGIGADGTMFVKSGIEIGNGALCVGGAITCASASASTAGEIYADGAINATDFDLAEMFNSNEYLVAGDIITVDGEEDESIRRAQPGDIILGAISTAPGLVLGWGGENQYPVALAGRVPVKVSDENGSIAIGDRVTLGTSSGIGMKATDAGEILGIAMQPSSGGANDAIVIFIQPQYWNGDPEEEVSVTEQVPSSVIQTNSVLAVSDNVISNIASLRGMNWDVDAEGVFTTEGTYDLKTKGHQNKDVITHAVTGLENYITMAGTTELDGKSAKIEFEKIDPEFNDVIEADTTIFVTATMSNGSGNVYVTDKTMNGFTLHRESGTGTEIDWVVTAFRKGFAPDEDDEVVEEEEEVVDEVVDEPIEELPVEEPVVDEPVDETPVEDEEPVEEPVVDEPVEEPLVEEPIEEPVDEPVVEEVIEEVIEELLVVEEVVDEVIEDELEVLVEVVE